MTKKTTATKAVAVSVDKVLKENERLAGELAKAIKQCNEQANAIACLHRSIEKYGKVKTELEEQVSALATRLDCADKQRRKELSEKQAYRRDVEILKVRCKMAENELFNVKTKLFAKIHEHEAIMPNDHSALTDVLPSLVFDVRGEIA